jgi:hypothetical protein
MGKLYWDSYILGQGMVGSIDFLNQLCWNLTIQHNPERWRLYAGDQVLFEAFSEVELESFIQGMAIALAVLPEKIINEIKKEVCE